MNTRRALGVCWLGVWLVALPALAGCQRVGRGLVGNIVQFGAEGDAGAPPIVGCKRPQCGDAGAPVAAFEGEPFVPLDLTDCEPCSVSTEFQDAAVSADAGNHADAGVDCAAVPPPNLDPLGSLPEGVYLACARQHVSLDSDPSQASVTLRGLRLRQVELTLEALRPFEVVLDGAHLEGVVLSLEGPVTLVVLAPVRFSDVQVSGVERTQGVPSLRVAQNRADRLRVGSPLQRFEGQATLERVEVTNSQLVAEDVRLESMTFYDGLIDASSLSTADSDLDTVELRVDEAQLTAGRLNSVQVTRCGRLALLGMDSDDGRYAACDPGPLRVNGSSVFGGLIDGAIETELTEYSRVRFGLRDATELTLWGGVVYSSAFCGNTGPVVFDGLASCVACEAGVFEEPGSLCNPYMQATSPGNFCEAFKDIPKCGEVPNRPRPSHGRPKVEERISNALPDAPVPGGP